MSGLEPPFDDTVVLQDMIGEQSYDEDVPNGIFPDDTEKIISDGRLEGNGREDPDDSVEVKIPSERPHNITKARSYVIVAVLLFINLLNYMDRFTIAGVLTKIRPYYQLDDQLSGLLQTVFIVSYMLLSPLFGYLGDRYNRKIIMVAGICFWSGITLASSFVPANMFGLFLFLRGCVGIGEASYSTIAPTLIADLFVKDMRTKMLAIFYFAIPIGSGLGYIVGSEIATALGNWKWALRVTPVLGVICVILISTLVKEPPRGQAEGGTHLHSTSYLDDLKYLLKNKSFVWSTLGFTSVAFVTGALALWAPTYVYNSILVQDQVDRTPKQKDDLSSSVSLTFGIITCLAGFFGVGIGAESARRLRSKFDARADPFVCAFGLLSCMPFLYVAIVVSQYNTIVTWVLIFLGETLLCLNWSIVADILLGVVIPTRRSTAEAVQIVMSHLLGDAGSPYLIGLMSDKIRGNEPKYPQYEYFALQYALYITAFVAVLGGGAFLATAIYIVYDKKKTDKIIHEGLQAEVSTEEDTVPGAPAEPI
ncbi:protein spinster homolog 1 isoform X2 [Lingula anatina]|uniref:Protein spinster homolog 1 isoform X2 n=1 Tax=Lingula anatina TaxID=7574 RepID=A0A1S3JSB8_LINAN|nr:protein spinster homolog 1 isoform X2 [Lingula anatina]|eukprot:XP_013413275.1 protein spinster homolog 1 isoform X2 [Lingula anatina]